METNKPYCVQPYKLTAYKFIFETLYSLFKNSVDPDQLASDEAS